MSFQNRLKSGEFVVIAEMHTPKGVDISRIVTDARRIKGRVDAIVIPDMDNGIMRMSAMAGGVLIQQQGIEAMIHVYGRDRNRMALQGDLLAAHVLGIQNLIVVHGEEMTNGDHRDADAVDDLDEVGAAEGTSGTLGRAARIWPGSNSRAPPNSTPDAPSAPLDHDADLTEELDRPKRKWRPERVLSSPRRFLMPNASMIFTQRLEPLGVPVVPTVFLIKSVAMARYIATNEPGARLSEDLITRIRKSPDREMEGVRIAGETVAALKEIGPGRTDPDHGMGTPAAGHSGRPGSNKKPGQRR